MFVSQTFKKAALALAVMAFVSPLAVAQSDFHTRDTSKSDKKHAKDTAASQFPNATRTDPENGLSESLFKPVNDLLGEVNQHGREDDVIATGTKLAGGHDAKPVDLAYIYEAMGYAYINKGDDAKAIESLQKSLGEDAMSNNDQYQEMLLLAKVQIRANQTDAGLATLARVVSETKQDKPEYDGIRGEAYYTKKDYANAAKSLQKAVDASPKPDVALQQRLMSSYVELKQDDRAEKIGEGILHANPSDKAAISNLVTVYQNAGHADKAIALLDDARKRGLLDDADGYRTLYVLYSQIKGHENDSIAVINDGLQKGLLQPGEEVYLLLGDDYYFTDRTPQAIDAYKKADAAATDGEPAAKLAAIYNNQRQAAEAKAMAQRAMQKGVKHPEDLRVILNAAGGAKGKKPGKK
ncbi:MAG TPA: tetratricopeptide repeat protein [Xanthomonadaceae bacterium]|jgi:tetratricopeptide (TPR) repeat protein